MLNGLIIVGILGIVVLISLAFGGGSGGSGSISWRVDFEQAVRESAESGKPLLVDFTADWCPPCREMKKEVWTDDRVAQEANARFIPVLIDVDKHGTLARDFGVRAIPTIKVIKEGREVYSQSGYHDVDAMLKVMAELKN